MDDQNQNKKNSELVIENKVFFSETSGKISLKDVLGTINQFINSNPKANYSIAIGSDSDLKNINGSKSKYLHLVTALLIYRHGYGGRYFRNIENIKNINSLRQKIYAETMKSLNFAIELKPILKKYFNGNYSKLDFEIHVDIGENGKTKEMISEIVGMIKGNGFNVKTKPNAYVASKVADRHT